MEIAADSNRAAGSAILVLHLLGRCNLQCLHCYTEGSPTSNEQLPVSAVLETIAQCAELGIGSVYLTGGEPLLYREIHDVLRAAADVPGLQVTLCTNGISITQRHIDLLRDLNASVNVSIDGKKKFHDYFRNMQGAFHASERSVRMLAEAGIPLTIVTTVSQGNHDSLPRLAEWAAQSGAKRFCVQPLLALGRGLQIADWRLTTVQMNRLLLQLSDLANQYGPMGLTCNFSYLSRRFLLEHPCAAYVCNGSGCHRRVAGEIKRLIIREDGTVLPEIANLSHRFALGKVEDGPLSQLVNRFFEEGGYGRFDQLCRVTYAELLPTWESEVVPWDQIVAERSHIWIPPQTMDELSVRGCGCHSTVETSDTSK
ncbi:MAG: radical SAM protein [Syntrophobacteraceae bacterium]